MDIDILLLLQMFRQGAGKILLQFMEKMTWLGETSTLLVIIAVIYWCLDKKFGSFLMMGLTTNRLVNGFVKVTACTYRPWIRDARIKPASGASGYSFPSGHATNAGSVYGGAALREKRPLPLRILLYVMIALVALSRCFIGVHTPQDVLCGSLLALLCMWLLVKLEKYIEEHPEKDVLVLGIGIAAAFAIALYAGLKPYPEDYDEAGKLIVDGASMANDTFKSVGSFLAWIIGWVLERRYIRFDTDVSKNTRLTRCLYGVLGHYAVTLILNTLIKSALSGPISTVLQRFLQTFWIMFLFPWLFTQLEKRKQSS